MVANSPNKAAKEVNYGGNTADYWKKIQDAKVQKLTDSHRDMLSQDFDNLSSNQFKKSRPSSPMSINMLNKSYGRGTSKDKFNKS